jgi:hypothetical protein
MVRPRIVIKDDRTEEQKLTHIWGVVATDRFMSGWGGAKGGNSKCAWACPVEVNTDRVYNWVKARKEMKHVNLVDLTKYRPSGCVHFHIYVCGPDHVAAKY